MKRYLTVSILALLCAGLSNIMFAQPPGNAENSTAVPPGLSAERMLTIIFDQRLSTPEELSRLFTTRSVVRRAAQRVWPDKKILFLLAEREGQPKLPDISFGTEFKPNLQTVSEGNAGVITGTLTVFVSPDPGQKSLDQLMTAINEQVLSVLSSRENILREQAELATVRRREELDRIEAELSKYRMEQRKLLLLGQAQPSSVLLEGIQQLQKEQQTLELELISNEVRIAALEKEIAAQREKSKAATQADDVVQTMQELIKEREKGIEFLHDSNRKAPGSIGESSFGRARQELLTTKVQLGQAMSERRKDMDDRIEQLVDQLTQCTINQKVNQARQQFAKQQLEEKSAQLAQQEEIAFQAQQLDSQIARLAKAQERLSPLLDTRLVVPVSASIKVEDTDLPKAEQAAPGAKEATSE